MCHKCETCFVVHLFEWAHCVCLLSAVRAEQAPFCWAPKGPPLKGNDRVTMVSANIDHHLPYGRSFKMPNEDKCQAISPKRSICIFTTICLGLQSRHIADKR